MQSRQPAQAWGQARQADTGTSIQMPPNSAAHLDLAPQPSEATLALVPCSSRLVKLYLQLCNLVPHLAARLVSLFQLPQARRLAARGRMWGHAMCWQPGDMISFQGSNRAICSLDTARAQVFYAALSLFAMLSAQSLCSTQGKAGSQCNAGLHGPVGD